LRTGDVDVVVIDDDDDDDDDAFSPPLAFSVSLWLSSIR